jgi:hypothetical protein
MISHIRMIKGIGPRVAIVFFVAFICKECVGSEEPLFQLTVSASVDGPAVKALRGFGKDLNKIITDVVAPSAAPSLVSILTTDVSLAPTVTDIPVAASARAGTSGSTAPTVSVIPNPPPRATPTAAKARDGTSGSLAPTSSPKTLAKPAVILSSAPTTSDIPTASASGRYSSPASVMVSVTDTPTAIPSSAVQIQATSLPTTSPSSYVESKKYALAASNDQKNVSVSVTLVAPTPLPLF